MLPSFVIVSYFIFCSFVSALPQAATKPPKGAATIQKVDVDAPDVDTEGSGCRAGSVGVFISEDNNFMTLIFDDFQAAIGPKAGSTKKRAFCRVNVTMASPGWAFDVKSVDFRGYVDLGKGIDASLVSRWKWIDPKTNLDIKGKGNTQKKLTGPFKDDFLLHKDGEVGDGEQSICSTKASAKFQLSLSVSLSSTVSTSNGHVKGDSADAAFGEVLNLGWRKC
ncbi:hypothetical protein BU24DRAFT_404342 [Aaosphaeria arxii CBS 175.79]|uniref:Secreted protein n=1 Tax=Aaosphaeria arxii CBS 175.79 TaxID=1450172 RepID=A0A6A5Y9Q9_9PLEO|nr:uncharacterized protein BU24DRAFT_404342 [Aaosphaeria arxii CBS 175.79]KAF2021324.1 hypothetical protein BU24DRAFT_404342 [Aaosphaeria arxii CBS 175.79]